MKHSVKVTVLDKKLYPELQEQYLADAAYAGAVDEAGAAPDSASNMQALKAAQEAFAGAAEEAGLETIDDVVELAKGQRSSQ